MPPPPLPKEMFVDILSCFNRLQLCHLQSVCSLLRSLTQSHFATHPRLLVGHYSQEAFDLTILATSSVNALRDRRGLVAENGLNEPLECLVLFAGTQQELDEFTLSNPLHYVASTKWRCICLGDIKSPFPNSYMMTANIAIFFHQFTDPSLLDVLSSFSHPDPLSPASASSRKILNRDDESGFQLVALKDDSVVSYHVMEKILTEIAFCESISIRPQCTKSLSSLKIPFFTFPTVHQACNIGISAPIGMREDQKQQKLQKEKWMTIRVEDIVSWMLMPPPPQPAHQPQNTKKDLSIGSCLIDGHIPELVHTLLQLFKNDKRAVSHEQSMVITNNPIVEGVTDLTSWSAMNNRGDRFRCHYERIFGNMANLWVTINESGV